MDQFGEENRIPFLNIEEGDIGVLIGFPIGGLLIAGFLGLNSFVLPLVAVGLGVGVGIVYTTPTHLTAWGWLKDACRYLKRPQVTDNGVSGVESSQYQEAERQNRIRSSTAFQPDERTQDLTNIKRAWSGVGAIQRPDGAMEAFVEIEPANMDFSMSDNWAHVQETAQEFANKELDFKLKFHATTHSFPVEKLVGQIDDRLTDEDVQQNPVFTELLEEYRAKRPAEMRDRGTQQVRYFIGVEVNRLEVFNRYTDEHTPAEKLTTLPVIGFLFNPFVTRRESLSETEFRAKMFEKLDDRVMTVRSELIQNIPGWSARRLSTVELFVLMMDFWNGEEHDYGDNQEVVRQQHAVGHSQRGGDVE
nr:hypothetical protein [Halorussus salinisoli]